MMLNRLPHFRRSCRGGALVEFAITGVLSLLLLIGTIEWGIELYARQAAEGAVGEAARNYALNRSRTDAESAAEASSSILVRCGGGLDIRLFDTIAGIDLLAPGAGRAVSDGPGDASASLARVTYVCDWERITPLLRAAFGPAMQHGAMAFVRLK